MHSIPPFDFAHAVTEWQERHGRHGLPWQNTQDPYRVWLSEIMLQQTQVATVLGYFDRFLSRFPNVQALADATESEVLALWSGLGYYSRARHLHRCSRQLVTEHGGRFPQSAHELQQLPGIGPSTAAAIASFCFAQPVSIYDGNVKRVLSRYLGFDGDISQPAADKALQKVAQTLVPSRDLAQNMPRYTQGLMDLGAMVCTRTQPKCLVCPLKPACVASGSGDPTRFPIKTRRVLRKTVSWFVLLLRQNDKVWLVQRPARGIWASLHAPPIFESESALLSHPCVMVQGVTKRSEPFVHSLTHRDIVLHPAVCDVGPDCACIPSLTGGIWVGVHDLGAVGLPAPISKLLKAGC